MKGGGDAFRLAVLEFVNEQAATTAALDPEVELFDKRPHRGDVRWPVRDDEYGIEPLDGQQAYDAGQRRCAALADDLLQFLHHGLGVGVLEPEHRKRHALEPVDVERPHGREQFFESEPRTAEDEHVASRVDLQRDTVGDERRQDSLDLGRRGVFQRHDLEPEAHIAARRVSAHRRRARRLGGRRERQDPVDAVVEEQRGFIELQH